MKWEVKNLNAILTNTEQQIPVKKYILNHSRKYYTAMKFDYKSKPYQRSSHEL